LKEFYQAVTSSFYSNNKIIIPFLFSICCMLLFSSCASTPSREKMNSADTHIKLGSSYLENGQFNDAFMEFQKAIKLNPRSKETLNYLGYLSTRFEKYDEAISYYKKAISIDPDYSEAMNNLGVTYAETENWDEALTYFDAALSNHMYDTPESAFANKGYVLYMKGDYSNAERAVKEALIKNRLFPLASYVLGLIYTKLDDDDAAIEEFKKAIGLAPGYAEVHMELAKTYLRSGNKAKALKHFEAVLENDKNPLRLREASDQISRLKY
jgi:type IV pilus assembly protein PilF